MILTLAFRHLWVKKARSLFLLLGFGLGVAVMIVLLSVGEALLEQSRDVALVGGGEVTVLPEGIDVEAMRTGGLSGMFFGIDRARYLTRQVLGGRRHAALIRTVAPAIEGKLLYLERGGRVVPVRAGGEIPSRAAAAGAGIDVRAGVWQDSPADSAWLAPGPERLYHELDRFHLPSHPDSTWAEWHYFNLVVGPREWWYLTFLVGGEVGAGRWGGLLLATHRRPDGRYERFTTRVPRSEIALDTTRADLELGASFVRQRGGVYALHAEARGRRGPLRLDLSVRPVPARYFPPVELRADRFVSGYVVPALAATASGRVCAGRSCAVVRDAAAYHDHNWGAWRGVTWEWGAAQGERLNVLYGGVYAPNGAGAGEAEAAGGSVAAPLFLVLVDSLGVQQVLRFRGIRYEGSEPAAGLPGGRRPERFELAAAREADTVRLRVRVTDGLVSRAGPAAGGRPFLQVRGRFTLHGRVLGGPVADSGSGFFETYLDGVPIFRP